jgi:hypothetical protein
LTNFEATKMALILYLVALSLYLIYKWATSTYDFFEKQGVKFRKPVPMFGTNANIITRKKPFTDILDDWYYEFTNEK